MNAARRTTSAVLVAVSTTILGCTDADSGGPAAGDPVVVELPADPEGSAPLDALDYTLTLRSSTVESGAPLRATLGYRNAAGRTLLDPSCLRAAGNYGLASKDDPTAEPFLSGPTLGCGGPFEIVEGDAYAGDAAPVDAWRATDARGRPLPPGRYLAVFQPYGRTDRFEVPVNITGPDDG